MMKNKLFISFIATLVVAIFLRLFVIDVVSVTNDLLQPQFYPGDFLLISKLSSIEEGKWYLVKNYPSQSIYAVRKVVEKVSDTGWNVVEPRFNPIQEEKVFVDQKNIVGRAVFILWSLPCKPAVVANGVCPPKSSRFFKFIN